MEVAQKLFAIRICPIVYRGPPIRSIQGGGPRTQLKVSDMVTQSTNWEERCANSPSRSMCRSKNTESGQPEGVRILIEVGQDRSHCGRHRWGELNWEVVLSTTLWQCGGKRQRVSWVFLCRQVWVLFIFIVDYFIIGVMPSQIHDIFLQHHQPLCFLCNEVWSIFD